MKNKNLTQQQENELDTNLPVNPDAVSAASITEMAFMSAVTMNGSDDGNVSALNDADGTSDAVNNTDNVVQQAWAESATHSLDKKPKPVTMGNEKKRRERISSSIHTLADMLPEAMRDPKHKEHLNVILLKTMTYIKELRDQVAIQSQSYEQHSEKQMVEELHSLQMQIQRLTETNAKYVQYLTSQGFPEMIAQNPDILTSWRGKGSATIKTATGLMNSPGVTTPQCITTPVHPGAAAPAAGLAGTAISTPGHPATGIPAPGLMPDGTPWSGVAPPGTVPMGLGPPGTIPVSTPQGLMFLPPLLPAHGLTPGLTPGLAPGSVINPCMTSTTAALGETQPNASTTTVPNSRHLGVHTSVATSGTDENVPTQESPDSGVGGEHSGPDGEVLSANEDYSASDVKPNIELPKLADIKKEATTGAPTNSLQGNFILHNGQLLLINDEMAQSMGAQPLSTDGTPTTTAGPHFANALPPGIIGVAPSGINKLSPRLTMQQQQQLNLMTQTIIVNGQSQQIIVPNMGVQNIPGTQLTPTGQTSDSNSPATSNSGVLAVSTQHLSAAMSTQSFTTAPTAAQPGPSGPIAGVAGHGGPNTGAHPQALLLPNGQIVPVVTQPNLLLPSATGMLPSSGLTTPAGASALPGGLLMTRASSVVNPAIAISAKSTLTENSGKPVKGNKKKRSKASQKSAESATQPPGGAAVMSADGTLLFTLPPNPGQPGNLILDPNTLAMFGGTPAKKNAGQRLIMPKPVSGANTNVTHSTTMSTAIITQSTNSIQSLTTMLPVVTQPTLQLKTTTTKTVSAKTKVVSSSISISTPLSISVSASNTPLTIVSPSTQGNLSTEDILAKATQSIFTEAASELSTTTESCHVPMSSPAKVVTGSYYGPKHEDDDALHIDTDVIKCTSTTAAAEKSIINSEEASNVGKPLTVITDSKILDTMHGSPLLLLGKSKGDEPTTTSSDDNDVLKSAIVSSTPSYMDISPVSTLSPSDVPMTMAYTMPTMSAISNLSSVLVSSVSAAEPVGVDGISGTLPPFSTASCPPVSMETSSSYFSISNASLTSTAPGIDVKTEPSAPEQLPESVDIRTFPESQLSSACSFIKEPSVADVAPPAVSAAITPVSSATVQTSGHQKSSPHKKRKKDKKDKKERKEKKRKKKEKERKRLAKEAADAALAAAGSETTTEKSHNKRSVQDMDKNSPKKQRTSAPQQELSDIANTMGNWATAKETMILDKATPNLIKPTTEETLLPVRKSESKSGKKKSKKALYNASTPTAPESSVYDFPDSPENLAIPTGGVLKTTPKNVKSNISKNEKDYLADLSMKEKPKRSAGYTRSNVSHFIMRSKSEEAQLAEQTAVPETMVPPKVHVAEVTPETVPAKVSGSSGKKKKKHKSKSHDISATSNRSMNETTNVSTSEAPTDASNMSEPSSKKGRSKSPQKKGDGESGSKKRSKSKKKSKNKHHATVEPKLSEGPPQQAGVLPTGTSPVSDWLTQSIDNVLVSPNKSNDDLVININQSAEKSPKESEDPVNSAGLDTFFKVFDKSTKGTDAEMPSSLVFSASELPDVLAKVESLGDSFSISPNKPSNDNDLSEKSSALVISNSSTALDSMTSEDSTKNDFTSKVVEADTGFKEVANDILDTPTFIHKTTPRSGTSTKKRRRLNMSPEVGPSSPDFMKDFRSLEVDVDLNETDDTHFVTPSFGIGRDTKKRERSRTPPSSLSQLSPLPTLNTPAPPPPMDQLSPTDHTISSRSNMMNAGLELLSMETSFFSPLPADSLLTSTPISPTSQPATTSSPVNGSSTPARHSNIASLAKGLEQPRTPQPVTPVHTRTSKRSDKSTKVTVSVANSAVDVPMNTNCPTSTVTTTQLADLPGNSAYKNDFSTTSRSESIQCSTSSCIISNASSSAATSTTLPCSVNAMPPPPILTSSPSKCYSNDDSKGANRRSSFEPPALSHLSPGSAQINSPRVQSPYSVDSVHNINSVSSASSKTSPQCAVTQAALTPQSANTPQSVHTDHSGRCSVDSVSSNRSATNRPYSTEPVSNSPTSLTNSRRFTSPKQGVFSPPPNITVGSQKLQSSGMPSGAAHSSQHSQSNADKSRSHRSTDYSYPNSGQCGPGYNTTPFSSTTPSTSGTSTFSFSLSSTSNTASFTSSTNMPSTYPTTAAPSTQTSSLNQNPVVSSAVYGHMPPGGFPPFPTYLPYPSSGYKPGSRPDGYDPALNLSSETNNFTPETSNRTDCRNPQAGSNKIVSGNAGYMNSYETTPLYHRNPPYDQSRQGSKSAKEDPPSLRHMGPPPASSSTPASYYPSSSSMPPQTSPRQSTNRLQPPTNIQESNTRQQSAQPQQSASRSQSCSMNSPSYEPPAIQLNNQSRTQKNVSQPSIPTQQTSSRSQNPPASQTPAPNPPAPAKPKSKSKSSSKSKSKKTANSSMSHKNYEVDTNLSNSIFEAPNRTMTPMFNPSQGMVGPGMRGQGSDGPTYLPSNIFPNSTSRPLSSNTISDNTNSSMHHKNSSVPPSSMAEMSQMPFNSLFTGGAGVRSQNGLAPPFNFQTPGFPMNPMSGHTSMGQASSNSGTSTPHMSNNMMSSHPMSHGAHHMGSFPLSTNFFDMNPGACPDPSALNMSPIKFPGTTNPMHHQSGVPNPMDPHQGSSFYHNRSHLQHHPMAFNNILAHNAHHGFDARTNAMGAAMGSMGAPFGGHHGAPPFAMPHLNFSMHEH